MRQWCLPGNVDSGGPGSLHLVGSPQYGLLNFGPPYQSLVCMVALYTWFSFVSISL